jgi:hypothetical protein
MKPQFDYAICTGHRIGLVNADEQARLCQSWVCSVGRMGSAVPMDLPRACVVRSDPQPESLDDPTLRKPEDAITEKDERAAVSERVRHDSFEFAALRRSPNCHRHVDGLSDDLEPP